MPATFEMRLSPPMITSATKIARTNDAATTTSEYVPIPGTATVLSPVTATVWEKVSIADEIDLTCEKVPIPNKPTIVPKTAKRTARILPSTGKRAPTPFSHV